MCFKWEELRLLTLAWTLRNKIIRRTNQARGMDGYTEQTDKVSEGLAGGGGLRLAREHTCVYVKPMDSDNDVTKVGTGGLGRGLASE